MGKSNIGHAGIKRFKPLSAAGIGGKNVKIGMRFFGCRQKHVQNRVITARGQDGAADLRTFFARLFQAFFGVLFNPLINKFLRENPLTGNFCAGNPPAFNQV